MTKIRDRKGTTKKLCEKDFAERSGELSGANWLQTLVLLGSDLVAPTNCSENSLVLFVRFFGFVSPFWHLKKFKTQWKICICNGGSFCPDSRNSVCVMELPSSGSSAPYLQLAILRKPLIREMPPGLLQHVLTVLVFWSWVLLLPRLPPWSRSLGLFAWASILLYAPWDIAWICCPQLPHHPCKNGTHSTCFYSTGGHTPN